ncbi:hypothetical protein BGX34_003239 [Mortierella sp. NVP85]|nr:hypothetical protein BGX34_003239 [Mortierella sp. NVP85]
MGILSPNCVTSNERSIYGISVESNYAPRVVLIKSNDNPSSLADIRWNIVSTIQAGAVYNISSPLSPMCKVDEKGVFTYVDLNIFKTPGSPPATGGIQYSPAHPANAGSSSTGPGGWKNIDTGGPFPWDVQSQDEVAFNVPDAAGNNVLTYMWSIGSAVQFGYLDSATMQLQAGPQWKFPQTMNVIRKNYFNKTLVFYAAEGFVSPVPGVLTIPFDSPMIAPAPPANFTGYRMRYNETRAPLITGFFSDTFYSILRRYDSAGMPTDTLTLVSFADLKAPKFIGEFNLTEPINTFRDTRSARWLVIGGHEGAPVLGFYYRMDFRNTSFLSAVHLDGPNIGKWESVPWKINVSEPFGIYTYPPPRRTGPPESSSSPSTGLIVGCVLGGLAVIGVAVFLFIYYSRRMTKQMNEAYSKKQQQHQQQQQSLAGSPVEAHSDYDTKQKPYEVHNTNLSPTAAFVPSFQQQINLSSHPRPNVVSTLADQGGAKAEIEEVQGGSKAELEEDSTSLQSLGPPPSFQASSLPPAQVPVPQSHIRTALGHRIGDTSSATPESKSSSDLMEALRGTVYTARNCDRPGNGIAKSEPTHRQQKARIRSLPV